MSALLLRLAWREIRNNPRFALFFVLNLALGLYGFIALGGVKASVEATLRDRARLLLTADLAVEARRPLTPEEEAVVRATIGPEAAVTRTLSLYSMVRSGRQSRLAEIAAVEPSHPFYGKLVLSSGQTVTSATDKNLFHEKAVWLDPDLALQLQAKTGDAVTIGTQTFRVSDIVTEDDGKGWRSVQLASRLYMSRPALEATGLLQKGSVTWHAWLVRLPPGADANALAVRLNERLSDPGVNARSAQSASESTGRMQGFLNDYLGLAALTSLFLAALGAVYLFRAFLAGRLREIAVLVSLGLPAARARRLYTWQVALLGMAAALTATVAAWASLPLTIRVLAWFLPFPVASAFPFDTLIAAVLIGVLGSILLCQPFLRELDRVSAAGLFHESALPTLDLSLRSLLWTLPAALLYAAVAVWQARSWKTGGLFLGTLALSGLLMTVLGGAVLKTASALGASLGVTSRLAARHVARNRVGSLAIFVTLALGTLLLGLIPQIERSLATQIEQPDASQVPSLFLFDIQADQAAPLERFIASQGVALDALTPMIRGRLSLVNGKEFEKDVDTRRARTRESEREARFRNRGFNLTYRERLSSSETIVEGRDFSGRFDPASAQPAEVSVEKEFAKRLQFKLGDRLEFDIQGVPVEGRIVNFRKVRWTSFQPNFFVQFQPGALEDAPKTFLASIRKLPLTQKVALQNAVVERFPNVSMIDIAAVVEKILAIFRQMGWALRSMALLSVFSGLVVIFSIANHQAHTRRAETSLLKVLGASFGRIRRVYTLEFGTLALLGACAGTAGSFLVSYVLSQFLFDGVWVFAWQTPLALLIGVPVLSLGVVLVATHRTLIERPLQLLEAE